MCFHDDQLAGFIQYYIRDGMLMVEELQLSRALHRTGAFYAFCKFLLSVLPHDLERIEAYADRRNRDSIRLMERLGMGLCDDDPLSPFVHMRGSAQRVYSFFRWE